LDDDDQWMDVEHLARTAVLADRRPLPDLILANQRAFRAGLPVSQSIWIEDLEAHLRRQPDANGAYTVTPTELLRCRAHCHLNTTIVSRPFFFAIGGFDEALRYDQDRDFYLRAIDRAELIKFMPVTVSRHNIPDPVARTSISTTESELSRRLYQLRTSDKTVLFAARKELRASEIRYRGYLLRHIALEAARADRFDTAAYYAREALMSKFTWKWLGMTLVLICRHRFSKFCNRFAIS
jgi:hypothetical protein